MDHFRPLSRCLMIALIAGSAAAVVGAASDLPALRGERWQAPGSRVSALTLAPKECLSAPSSVANSRLIAIGRTAFADPLLLGGQAARMQISCATCHPSGRRNTTFLLPGLSDVPGTADVTSSMMSSHRGNGVFDPKPIPDLALAAQIERNPASPALPAFVHGLITNEFDGAEPPPIAFEGLLAYIRAVRTCQPDALEPITVDAAITDIGAAMRAALNSLRLSDKATARLMIGAARLRLGNIYERYDMPSLRGDQAALAATDRLLLALQQAIDRGDDIAPRLGAWQFPTALRQQLRRDANRSLYDPAVLAAKIAA